MPCLIERIQNIAQMSSDLGKYLKKDDSNKEKVLDTAVLNKLPHANSNMGLHSKLRALANSSSKSNIILSHCCDVKEPK